MDNLRDSSLAVATLLVYTSVGLAQVPPDQRTADMPDSWLVLYNTNSPDSIAWADWYCAQRGIPESNKLGLDASTGEHLPDLATAQSQIMAPVRNLLAADATLNQAIMGILLGYGLPGHYGMPPLNPTVGGFSIADALQDMTDDGLQPASQKSNNTDNPHYTGNILPPGGRKTRASMLAGRHMVARIDAPTLPLAMALTERALALSHHRSTLEGQSVWFDFFDPAFPSSNREWYWLRSAVQAPLLSDLPWDQFDLDNPASQTPSDAFRFDVYQLTGWNPSMLAGPNGGSRVLCFDFNSWGAVTVRSTTASGGLYVPNAIAAGYAAAIGATGEPQCCVGPFPDTLLASLREGWTLGEAFYLANPFNDWMWTLVGDPLLTLPNWFDPLPSVPGDINGDGIHDGRDVAGFDACMAGPEQAGSAICDTFDADSDGDQDLADYLVLQGTLRGGVLPAANQDFDQDGDVDLGDFSPMTACAAGPGSMDLEGDCRVFDADFDLDVDLVDFSRFRIAP